VRRLPTIAIAAALLAGCGEERTPPPDVRHADDPHGLQQVALPGAGVTFQAPANWRTLPAQPPMEGGIGSKTAIVAVWRYPRAEPLPAGQGQLARAQDRLVERIRARNPTFTVRSSELTEVGGARGIEVTGRQTINGLEYDVRSAHVFEHGAEVVVDAYAPPVDFARVDETVFVPLIESLTFDDTP
jgi:hypothetical protein